MHASLCVCVHRGTFGPKYILFYSGTWKLKVTTRVPRRGFDIVPGPDYIEYGFGLRNFAPMMTWDLGIAKQVNIVLGGLYNNRIWIVTMGCYASD